MTTITIKIDDNTLSGKRFLGFLETLGFVSIVSNNKKTGIDKALEDVVKGRIHKAKSTKDLMKKNNAKFNQPIKTIGVFLKNVFFPS
ncbi:MAG: hypothetical protein LBE82_09935 [Chitinophagaceae bacterium]|jgi:hypothetical protein|nr:hypothetical protein [Chitinophagaceae bacterium]